MNGRLIVSLCLLLLCVQISVAVDREIIGKVRDVDLEDQCLTVSTNGGLETYKIDTSTPVFDAEGKNEQKLTKGLLKMGDKIKVTLPANDNVVKKIYLLSSAK